MRTKWIQTTPLVLSFMWALACQSEPPVGGEPGSPLPGLTQSELARFQAGQALFNRSFGPEEGLGPLFNQTRCSSCHDLPTSGGSGAEFVDMATRFSPPATCDQLVAEGGNNIQQRATPLLQAHGIAREATPSGANGVAQVAAPSLYGLGLIEAIPLESIARGADPDDTDGDGVSGRVGRTADGRPARFGRKADFATVSEFVDGALRAEMGLTTPGHPEEETVNGQPVPEGADPAPDPEIDAQAFDLLVDYVRYLAPTGQAAPDESERELVFQGQVLFGTIGCAECHTPTLESAPHSNPVFNRRAIALYSDLLLHDLGSENADICGPGATPAEFRTARLMGLRHRNAFLHDGQAGSIPAAIMAHGGEGASARARWLGLASPDQDALIAFLNTR